MTFSFNLIDEPWIPCVNNKGEAVELNLQETLTQAHELREVWGESPLITASFYRLLLAVLHRVYNGPENSEAWEKVWKTGYFDNKKINDYLENWHERFDLFHPKYPFYQAPNLDLEPKAVNTILFDIASGNNATLFDHHTDDKAITLKPAQAARALLAAHTFGLAGLCLPNWPFTDAPWARGIVFLIQGDTLFETLMFNWLRYSESGKMPCKRTLQDCPAWEMDDPFKDGRTLPYGYLDYLTWQNRRIFLLPVQTSQEIVVQQLTIAPGLRLDSSIEDPMKHYYTIDEKHGYLFFEKDRALWRNSAALFSLRHSERHRPPRALNWLGTLKEETDALAHVQTRRLFALGMANNQAKIEFFRAERWPLPLAYLEDESLVETLEVMLKQAEDVASQLKEAMRIMAWLILDSKAAPEKKQDRAPQETSALMNQWGFQRRYWASLEVHFRRLIEVLPQARNDAVQEWKQTLKNTAHNIFYAIVENQQRAETFKAIVKAEQQLISGLTKVLG